MKFCFKILLSFLITLTSYANLNICSFAFNSTEEREALYQGLKKHGATLTEMTPLYGKDPKWFEKACLGVQKCDINVFSGHFGGLFFGEGSSITLSMAELLKAKQSHNCSKILDAKAVYLMGCNTMATKKKDHRDIYEYLNVLISDGFPLDLSEKVAATRYLDYGQSNEEIMSSIFSNANIIIGFESTGPLGRYAGPKLSIALKKSKKTEIDEFSISPKELIQAFKGTSIKVTYPTENNLLKLQKDALTLDSKLAPNAWNEILQTQNLNKYLSFIIENKKNMYLKFLLTRDIEKLKQIEVIIRNKMSLTRGLPSIHLSMLSFLKDYNLLSNKDYINNFYDTIIPVIDESLDYIHASQLCEIFKNYKSESHQLYSYGAITIQDSIYEEYLKRCLGIASNEVLQDGLMKCINSKRTHDWACLKENQHSLNVASCIEVSKNNPDTENSDDMLWYCYSHMRDSGRLDRGRCLELTDNFKILGNRLKMNWNCLNRIPEGDF